MQKIIVDMTPGYRMPTIYFSQGDVGTQFAVDLRSRFGDSLPASATVTVQATKPSGLGFSVAATSVTNGVAVFTTTAEMTDEAGRFPAEIKVVKDSLTMFTANFNMDGEATTHPEGTIDGQQDTLLPELTQLVERVEDAASSVLDMTVEAETLAAGSQATYSYDEDTNTATFGIPQGEAGAGAAGVTASAYSSSSTYAVGDYVIHNSNLYRCTTAITTAEAFTAAHWTQVVLGDDVSDLKSEISYNKDGLNFKKDSDIFKGYIGPNGDLTGGMIIVMPFTIDAGVIPLLEFAPANAVNTVTVYGLNSARNKIAFKHDVTLSTTEHTRAWLNEKNLGEANYLALYSPNGGVQYYQTSDTSIDCDGYFLVESAPNVGDSISVTPYSGIAWNGDIYGFVPTITIKSGHDFVVAKDGSGDFNTINDALDSVPNGGNVHILLMEGVYNEVLNMNARFNNVVIEGISRDKCKIQSNTGKYADSPVVVCGNFTLRNLTIEMTNTSSWSPTYDLNDLPNTFPGYALHIDAYSLDGTVVNYGLIENCILYSSCFPAVGMGLQENQVVEFRGCRISRWVQSDAYKYGDQWNGAFLCHSANVAGNPNQNLILVNNEFICGYGASAQIRASLGNPADFNLTAVNNVFYSWERGHDAVEYEKSTSVLNPLSWGNSATNLNNTSN